MEGVGPRIASSLEAAFGIVTVRDLLEHYPFRYRDIGEARPLAEATLGEPLTIVGTIERWDVIRPRRGRMVIAKARVRDEHGGVIEAPFFNQDWRSRAQPAGTRVAVSGTLERYRSQLQLKSPRLEVLDPADERSGPERFEPVYPATEKLPSWRIGRFVRAALERLEPIGDVLPDHLRRRHDLMELDTALRAMHGPQDLSQARAARDRLVYDELLCLQIGLQQRRWRLEADAVGIAQARWRRGWPQRSWSGCRSPPPLPSAARWPSWQPTSPGASRCTGCCRVMSGRARPWSRPGRCSWPSTMAARRC